MAQQATETDEKYIPILSRLRAPKGAVRNKKRRGRGIGSGIGKTGGKGQKGQKARHPGKFGKLAFEGGQMPLWQRIPKRGFVNHFAKKVGAFNVSDLSRFDANATVDIAALKAAGLVRKDAEVIKCLGNGEIDKALTVKVNAFSKSAEEKIKKAGGSTEILALPKPAPVTRKSEKK